MKISILIVALNAGSALEKTVDSILRQSYTDYEIIIKDGGSTDGSIDKIHQNERIRMIVQKDEGIYDAMNQAAEFATGDYAVFLNCGDVFFDKDSLKNVVKNIQLEKCQAAIFYGDCYTVNRRCILHYPKKFTDYICFTKVLCHQATFYPVNYLNDRKFNRKYKMAADYEYYVHAYKNGYQMIHMPVVVVSYEGNGISEKKVNRCLILEERKAILKENYDRMTYRRLSFQTKLHGVGIKQFLVKQEWFYAVYKQIAKNYYNMIHKLKHRR